MHHRSIPILVLAVAACSGDATDTSGLATCAAPGGPVAGAADGHCGGDVQAVDPRMCTAVAGGGGADFGDTMYGAEGDDDDCKYHVSWTSTAVCEGGPVFFTVTATVKADGSPLVGADPSIEGFMTADTGHVLPNSGQHSQELGGGRYKIGPIELDRQGQWTVRFHFYETCTDTPASPHGHAAFFLDVP